MGLRSRKAGAADARADFERQLEQKADKPLYDIHVQTEAFNMMWRDFLFKLCVVLVFYSAYALWEHSGNRDHAAFDLTSLSFYVLTATWVSQLKQSTDTFWRGLPFKMSLALLVGQSGFFGYYLVEQNYKIDKEFFPTSAIFAIVLFGSLLHMRSNVKLIEKSRADLNSVKSSLHQD